MRDARCLAGRDACHGRQHPGVQPLRLQRCKGWQFLSTRSQQNITGLALQIRCGIVRCGKHGTAGRQGAGRAQQAVVFRPGCPGRRTDIARCLGRIGVCRINAKVRIAQQGGHFFGVQPTGADCDTRGAPLLLGSKLSCHTDRDRCPQRRQCAGKSPSLGGAAENDCFHTP